MLDCPPALDLLTLNCAGGCGYGAHSDAGGVLCARRHLASCSIRWSGSASNLNPTLAIEGVVLTMFDERTNLAQQVTSGAEETILARSCARRLSRATFVWRRRPVMGSLLCYMTCVREGLRATSGWPRRSWGITCRPWSTAVKLRRLRRRKWTRAHRSIYVYVIDRCLSMLVGRRSTPDPSPRWRGRAVFGMTHCFVAD